MTPISVSASRQEGLVFILILSQLDYFKSQFPRREKNEVKVASWDLRYYFAQNSVTPDSKFHIQIMASLKIICGIV